MELKNKISENKNLSKKQTRKMQKLFGRKVYNDKALSWYDKPKCNCK